MGYSTSYYGTIKLFDKKAIEILKELEKNSEYPFEDNEFELVEDEPVWISLSCEWKDYEDEMEKVCLFIAMLDKKAQGIINCSGEEDDDLWRIVIGGGKILVESGYVKYENPEKFDSIETKKKIYEITKDKKLLKELMLESLE